MPAISPADIKKEAARIAALWDSDGPDAAQRAFRQQCQAWNLLRWEAVVFSDAVHAERFRSSAQQGSKPAGG